MLLAGFFRLMPPMLLSPAVFIGLRYTRAKRRHQFMAFISGFALVGMALGVLALIVVLSVMNGFDREIKQRILTVVPHGFVDHQPRLEDWQSLAVALTQRSDVVAAAPYIGGFAMLGSASQVYGVQLQAILPEAEQQVSVIDDYMLDGSGLGDLQPGEFGIVLGSLVARYLQVGIGDKVTMTLPEVAVTPAGVFPRSKRFRVVGTFEVGAQVDQSLAMIHLHDGQRLFRYVDAVQGLRLQTPDIYQAGAIMADLGKDLGPGYQLTDWSQTQGSLFQAVKMEKRMVTLLLMIIIAVAALNIVTSLVMMVADKRGDIAVLRTLGMTTRQMMAVFMVQGSAVGLTGALIGTGLGCLLALNISDLVSWLERILGIYIFDPNVYFINQLPAELRLDDVLIISGVAVVLSLIATLYPAWRAAQVAPAEVLRYE